MISFKRDIYKLKAPPRPPKTPKKPSWYRSEAINRNSLDFCLPITEQIFKDPPSLPISTGQNLYEDFSQNTPLSPQNAGADNIYNIANQAINTPANQNITAVKVDNSGLIVEIINGSCNRELQLQTVFMTIAYIDRQSVCSNPISIQVKVNTFDINQNTLSIDTPCQLYNPSSLNSNPQLLNPSQDVPGFIAGNTNFIGMATTVALAQTSPIFSAELNSDGIIINKQTC